MTSKLVALTGVSGYIAGSILEKLLKKGYQVNGTVRSLKNKEKVSHLLSIADTEEIKKVGGKLKLFEADLEKKGSFKDAFKGVSCVFHTASPFHFNIKDPEELIKPAVNGTTNVLTEALDAKTVKRVVLTSSTAAVYVKKLSDDHVISEKDWSEISRDKLVNDNHLAYCYSKTQAEKTAWELVKQWKKDGKSFELVVINPSFVFGPPRSSRNDSTSMRYISSLFDGSRKEMEEKSDLHCVDVRDVAAAHILAWENKNAFGRYLLTRNLSVRRSEVVAIVEKHFGDKYAISKVKKATVPQKKRKVDNSKTVKLLGRELISLEDSIKDTVEALIKFGFTK